jgi:6,7-dimethyl-8-ribityllumazine synthase
MVKVIQGELIARGKKFALIASRFNEFITNRLIDGAVDCLKRHGVKDSDIDLIWSPGSFEIPQIASKLTNKSKAHAIICLGAIIRGETPHFDYVASEAAKGIAKVALASKTPVAFGIITADTLEQAINRAGAKDGNKGFQAALSAIEMVSLSSKI